MDNSASTYFGNRNVSASDYDSYAVPAYLRKVLPPDKDARILDIGCGYGQLMKSLIRMHYKNVKGIDISSEVIMTCKEDGLNVEHITELENYSINTTEKYDFIIMSHVLEHIEKPKIIYTLAFIKEHLMAEKSALMVMVPNAQSDTGCYWAYEDFTHSTVFTTGSIYYVLRAAGFTTIEFLDRHNVEGANIVKRYIRLALLYCYIKRRNFWNWVTNSSFHRPSPQIFSYELKILAK
jgi:predicted TPR repeat methyltransferase